MSAADDQEFLKARVTDRNPKCATCNFWAPKGGAVRPCKHPSNRKFDGHDPSTADLSVCSFWEPKP